MQSPLAAKSLHDLFIDLRKCVDWKNKELLGLFIAHLTLRYEHPQCQLDEAWTEEDIGLLRYSFIIKNELLTLFRHV